MAQRIGMASCAETGRLVTGTTPVADGGRVARG